MPPTNASPSLVETLVTWGAMSEQNVQQLLLTISPQTKELSTWKVSSIDELFVWPKLEFSYVWLEVHSTEATKKRNNVRGKQLTYCTKQEIRLTFRAIPLHACSTCPNLGLWRCQPALKYLLPAVMILDLGFYVVTWVYKLKYTVLWEICVRKAGDR